MIGPLPLGGKLCPQSLIFTLSSGENLDNWQKHLWCSGCQMSESQHDYRRRYENFTMEEGHIENIRAKTRCIVKDESAC